MAKLQDYAAKRRFDATPEPAPAVADIAGGPLMFVVQQHAARRMHYDVRLECDGVLLSWAVPKGPSLDPADKRMAVQTEDHPYAYGSFEGVIPPKQYGAGEVIVWDCGVYSPDEGGTWYHDRAGAERRVREGLAAGKLSLQLRGEKLKGSFALVRTKDGWLLIKHKDRWVSTDDVTARARSVLCGAGVGDMNVVPAHQRPAAELVPTGDITPMPKKLLPMLAEIGAEAFQREGWLWEPKLDGYRVLAFVTSDGVKLQSRRGLDLTPAFPALVAELRQQMVDGMVLDGEIVAFEANGRPSFNALQNRVQLKGTRELAAADRAAPAVFFCFDLPWFAGIDLRDRPYADRHRYLAQCLLPTPLVQRVHATDDGPAMYEAALAGGFEGVVGKRRDSRYVAGRRSKDWLKVKPRQSAEFVVAGYTKGKGARDALGALLVGWWDDAGKLQYASHVGSGFDTRTLALLQDRLAPLVRTTMPFATKPELPNPTIWVEPRLVVEVEFQEWTPDAHLRAPVFLRLREDIDPKTLDTSPRARPVPEETSLPRSRGRAGVGATQSPRARTKASSPKRPHPSLPPQAGEGAEATTIETVLAQLDTTKPSLDLLVGAHLVKLTHLDRVYWPANEALQQPPLAKRDLLRYLAQVAPLMLPHLADRPLTMIRMPDGIGGQRFFQKHWEQAKPAFVETIALYSAHRGESGDYLLCNNLPTLLWLAQSGTLEFHVWHSRAFPGPDAASQSTDFAAPDALEASVLNYPDYVIFDIDPYIYSGKEAPGAEPELNTLAFEKGKQIAFRLRALLQEMGLEPIVKTSGKTGLHVFVPIVRNLDFDDARRISELVSTHLARRHPKEVTVEWSVPKRTGKIFMDYNMNVRGKTLNVAYSPRGEPGAPVSMPLAWDELATAHPLDFRLTSVQARLATGDRWYDALARKQDLGRLLGRG